MDRIVLGIDPFTGQRLSVSRSFLTHSHDDACPICRLVNQAASKEDPDRTLPPVTTDFDLL